MASDSGLSIDKAALEQKYIDLLEKRIAQLEARLSQDEAKAPTTSDTQGIKENGENGEATQASEGASRDEDKSDSDTEKETPNKDSKEKDENEPAPRVKHTIWKYMDKKDSWEDVEYSKNSSNGDEGDDKTKPMAIFRQVPDDDNPKKVDHYEIEISSPDLLRLLRETNPAQVQSDDSRDLYETSRIWFSPFTDFMWYWDKFEAACKPAADDSKEKADAREDLKQLMSLVRQADLDSFFKARDTALARGVLPFAYLWTLFSPGTKVYAKSFMDDLQMLEVVSCDYPTASNGEYHGSSLMVNCLGFDWDGTKFNTFQYFFFLRRRKNEKEVTVSSLDVYPTAYFRTTDGEHTNTKQQESLLKRGKRFWALCGNMGGTFQYEYSGPIYGQVPAASRMAQFRSQEREEDDDDRTSTFSSDIGPTIPGKKEYKGSVIIDAFSFLHAQDVNLDFLPLGKSNTAYYYFPNADLSRRSIVTQWYEQYVESANPEENYEAFAKDDVRLMMCPPRVLGYALKLKMWAQFRIQSCKDKTGGSENERNYFAEQLQLKDEYKDMLLAFVNSHQSSAQQNRTNSGEAKDAGIPSLDVIQGKGRGLAILLHGPPGVGKTLTAETIALATGRPLLTVAVAEVGTEAARAEAKLNVFFLIAARWGAILLVDEADVFLEERTHTDNPERNMLVSVLLRCLEYYEGIIFLTTNRIKSIDIAVQSRMHLAIQYKNLDEQSAAAIYRNLLDKVPDSKIKGDRTRLYDNIRKLLCRRNTMNGRQIRNIVSAALGLAKDREMGSDSDDSGDGRVQFEDLRKVYETTTDFLESLKDSTKKRRELNEAD